MMSKLTELFQGDGIKQEHFGNEDITKNREVFGKEVVIAVDNFSTVMFKGYKVEYINKDGDVVLHFYSKKWPDNFIDVVKVNIESMGDSFDCDFVPEMNSWWVRINNFSVRRFGEEADASYVSSVLSNL